MLLVRFTCSGTRFIFVGDKDQLPPIGPGAVFNDLMQLDSVPRAVLTVCAAREKISSSEGFFCYVSKPLLVLYIRGPSNSVEHPCGGLA